MLNAQDSGSLSFLRAQVDERDHHLEILLQRDAELGEENKRLAKVRASLEAEVARLTEELSRSRERCQAAEGTLEEIFRSRAWRLITMLRCIKAALLPSRVRPRA